MKKKELVDLRNENKKKELELKRAKLEKNIKNEQCKLNNRNYYYC